MYRLTRRLVPQSATQLIQRQWLSQLGLTLAARQTPSQAAARIGPCRMQCFVTAAPGSSLVGTASQGSTPALPTAPGLPPTIDQILCATPTGATVQVRGWVRSVRKQKSRAFIHLFDGSNLAGVQVLLEDSSLVQNLAITTGASVEVTGQLVNSPGKEQAKEIHGQAVCTIGTCNADSYPLQKKHHSVEFLRTIVHLRPRTKTFNALMRIRNHAANGLQRYLQDQAFVQVHTPIFTTHDCEGGGEVFRVTSNSTLTAPTGHDKGGSDTNKAEFFDQPVYTTVSGQLHAEVMASAFTRVYTFNPTFRAEPSLTYRHLAEFWMLETELAFIDSLEPLLSLAESMLRSTTKTLLDTLTPELDHFAQWVVSKKATVPLADRWRALTDQPFARISYSDAIAVLQAYETKHPKTFEVPAVWGQDLRHEHERFLCEQYFKGPVFVLDFPAAIKAFYMKPNPPSSSGLTAASVDLLVPGSGELMGGSLREHDPLCLEQRLVQAGLSPVDYSWYMDLRRFGPAPHGGFGLGFDRYVQAITGLESIRDVMPFARYYGHCQF
ncbi:asparaginyl-tRNA synthetase [Dimargaris verticillata]|uniref:Asparagine--tRNA ligase, mitochondrial n=1 Tax=Dimargaris verticillata TaxID=2761393 RepID=A0A9W8B198_9FUNG|nr:asparaginyl-tRNA synthetase [Dimargaris verticillata]